MNKMLMYGSASAAILIRSHGCSDFMPTLAELETFIAQQEKEFGKHVNLE